MLGYTAETKGESEAGLRRETFDHTRILEIISPGIKLLPLCGCLL